MLDKNGGPWIRCVLVMVMDDGRGRCVLAEQGMSWEIPVRVKLVRVWKGPDSERELIVRKVKSGENTKAVHVKFETWKMRPEIVAHSLIPKRAVMCKAEGPLQDPNLSPLPAWHFKRASFRSAYASPHTS